VKVVAVCLVTPCSLADMHRHFRASAASFMRVMEAAGSSQTMLRIYRLTEHFSFVSSRNTVPEERKSLHHFICLFYWGVHFNAFGVPEHVMSAVTVCITET